MRETRVERELRVGIKARGGWAIKLLPSVSGLPDRLVLLPGGYVIFVELKAPGKKAELHQLVIHRKLERLGFAVYVLDSVDAVKSWLALLPE
jgi:hypothetical protein